MEHGLITQVAKAAGFPVQTVWNYCKGNYRPKMERAKVLERATGIDKLIWLEGDPAKIQAALKALEMAGRITISSSARCGRSNEPHDPNRPGQKDEPEPV